MSLKMCFCMDNSKLSYDKLLSKMMIFHDKISLYLFLLK